MSGAWSNYADSIGTSYGLPSGLLPSVLQNESGFNPQAYNPASGATGIAQFLPSTAANPGYGIAPFDPTNPYASMRGAAQYLSALNGQLGSWTAALNQYSGGAPYAQTLGAQYDAGGSAQATPGSAATSGSGATSSSGSGFMGGAKKILLDGAVLLLAIVVIAAGVFFLKKK